jgi:hypothetical protein
MNQSDEIELQSFAEDCRQRLAVHVQALDPVLEAKLARARKLALTQDSAPSAPRAFRVPSIWLPAGVCAVAASLAVAVWVARPSPAAAPTAEVAAVEDAELLASGDEADFYAEDVTFYEWAGSASGAS